MPKCIVSTAPDRSVWITRPTSEFMSFFTNGGAPDNYWIDIDWDAQIASMVNRGIRERVAVKWVKCLLSGGLTDAEAYELICDRDTNPEWTAKELWDEIPTDRWFRNAWVRSHNGGPIDIDLNRAKPVQFREICNVVEAEKKRRMNDFDLFGVPLVADLAELHERCRMAQDEIELRQIWPTL